MRSMPRPLGLIPLAAGAAIVAAYSFATVLIVLGGHPIGRIETSGTGLGIVLVVAFALSLGLASVKVAYGLVRKRAWAWQGAITIFSIAFVMTIAMSVVGISVFETVALLVMSAVALRTLFYAEMRVELGNPIPSRDPVEVGSAA